MQKSGLDVAIAIAEIFSQFLTELRFTESLSWLCYYAWLPKLTHRIGRVTQSTDSEIFWSHLFDYWSQIMTLLKECFIVTLFVACRVNFEELNSGRSVVEFPATTWARLVLNDLGTLVTLSIRFSFWFGGSLCFQLLGLRGVFWKKNVLGLLFVFNLPIIEKAFRGLAPVWASLHLLGCSFYVNLDSSLFYRNLALHWSSTRTLHMFVYRVEGEI